MPPVALTVRAPASAVTFSFAGNFTSKALNELLVIKQNVVELYSHAHEPGTRMVKEGSVSLNAPPIAATVARAPGRDRDCLVLAFSHIHISVVIFDDLSETFETVAALQLAEELPLEAGRGGVAPFLCFDSARHILSIFFCEKWLAVVSFTGDGIVEEKTDAATKQPVSTTADDSWGDEDDVPETAAPTAKAEETPTENVVRAVRLCRGPLKLQVAQLIDCTQHLKRPLRQVRDVKLVPSFSDPTIAVLCEQQSTWAGRVKLADYQSSTVQCKSLSCSIVWLSLSLDVTRSNVRATEVGDVDGIPYTATHLIPMEAFDHVPGGVLCFSEHSLIHVTPKRRFGCYVNHFGREEAQSDSGAATSWSAMSWKGAVPERLMLQSLVTASISDRSLLGVTVEGGLLSITLETDGRSVVAMTIAAVAKMNVTPSCTARVGDLYFVGTTEGNSAFWKLDHRRSHEPAALAHEMHSLGEIIDADIVDLTISDKTNNNASSGASHNENPFLSAEEVAAFDFVPAISPREQAQNRELVVCSGRNDRGALHVCRDSLPGVIVHRNNLECVASFILRFGERFFLLLSTRNATIVLQSFAHSAKLTQFKAEDGAPYALNARTIFASSALRDTIAVQVTERDVVICGQNGTSFLTSFGLRPCGVTWASMFGDDILLIMYADQQLVAMSLQEATNGRALSEVILQSAGVVAVTTDVAHRLLFLVVSTPNSTLQTLEVIHVDPKKIKAPRTVVFSIPNFNTFPRHISPDELPPTPEAPRGKAPAAEFSVIEIRLVRMSSVVKGMTQPQDPHPSLFILTEAGECIVYKVTCNSDGVPTRLLQRSHEFVDRPRRDEGFVKDSIEQRKRRRSEERQEALRQTTAATRRAVAKMIPFDNVRGLSGVYVCGRTPRFYFSTGNNQVVSHLHQAPEGSAVRSFSAMDASWIPNGFVCCCEGFVVFCTLPPYVHVEDPMPWKRIPLHVTPHRVAACASSGGLYLITSSTQKFRPIKAPFDVELRISVNEDGVVTATSAHSATAAMPYIQAAEDIPSPVAERYRLEWLRNAALSRNDVPAPGKRGPMFEFDENEEILCSELIPLCAPESAASGEPEDEAHMTSLFCVGTAYPLGEDVACRGRLVLFRTTNSSAASFDDRKLMVVHKENTKGPVTAVTSISNDCFAVAVGGTVKVMQFDWNSEHLVVLAFMYSGLYITSLSSMHNILLIGDLHRSVLLVRYNDVEHTLEILGRHTDPFSVVSVGFLYRSGSLSCIATDASRDIVSLSYSPSLRASDGKIKESRLSLDASFRNPGGSVAKVLSLRRYSAANHDWVPQNKLLYVSNYGEIGYLMAMTEQDQRAYQWLSRRLQWDVPHAAALTPKLFLSMPIASPCSSVATSGIATVDLLKRILEMSSTERRALCAAAGAQLERTFALIEFLDHESRLL